MTKNDDEICVARKCVRCGTVLYVSMDDASGDASLCTTCRTGSLPVVQETPKRGGLFSRSKLVNAESEIPKAAPRTESSSPVADGEPNIDELEIVRAGTIKPSFTAESDAPKLRIIGPIVVVFLLAGLSLGILLTRERSRLPNTPAGERTAWLLEAMNDSRVIDIPSIHENFSESAIQETGGAGLLGQIRGWDQRHNAYVVGSVLEGDDPHRLVALITTEAMDWGELVVEVESASPHQILQFTIGPASAPR